MSSVIYIFKMLPKTNCGECGVPTCLAFAANLAAGKSNIDYCPYINTQIKPALSNIIARIKTKTAEVDWRNDLIGLTFDATKAIKEGWSDQESKKYHFGFPREKNLWIAKINLANSCDSAIMWIFILISLNDKMQIKKIDTEIYQTFLDGHAEQLHVQLFPPDIGQAIKVIKSIAQ